jgi:hypothetical protein
VAIGHNMRTPEKQHGTSTANRSQLTPSDYVQ